MQQRGFVPAILSVRKAQLCVGLARHEANAASITMSHDIGTLLALKGGEVMLNSKNFPSNMLNCLMPYTD
jgi:hypothetical protein